MNKSIQNIFIHLVRWILITVLFSTAGCFAFYFREKYFPSLEKKDPYSDPFVVDFVKTVENIQDEQSRELTEQFFSDKQELKKEYDKYISSLKSNNEKLEVQLKKINNNNLPILDLDRVKYPAYMVNEVIRMWAVKGGKYSYVPYCICVYESRFDTTTHATKGEDSRGLFQVNYGDPAHRKRIPNPNKLFDPRYNMDYQFTELVFYEKKGIEKGLIGTDLIEYVARYGQRPKWTQSIVDQISKSYKEYNEILIKK